MCGIAGVIDFRGREIAQDRLLAAREAVAHRGPDDRGLWRHASDRFFAALVHTRLAVLDTTDAGHQPFADPSGRFHLAYNGEVYNFADLRRSLEGRYPFRTQCDTEALHAALIHEGTAALGRLNGIFAFAFVDAAEHRALLARDPFGVKPLYYAFDDDRLVFASEMGAILPLLDDPSGLDIDREALHLFLSLGFIPHPLTVYRGVRKLGPGCLLALDPGGGPNVSRYHRLAPAAPPADYGDASRELRGRIGAAVAAQRIADVPLGAFLSGGLDSSVVVAELARSVTGPLKTFSIGYADQPQYDETRYARLVAERFDTEHHEFKLTARDVLEEIPALLDHLAEPFADASLIPTSLVSRHTRGHVTVALSGDGGDELFAGYWRYLGHRYIERYRRIPSILRRGLVEPLLRAAPSAKSSPLLNRIRQARKLLRGDFEDPFDRHAAWSRLAEAEVIDSLVPGPAGVSLAEMLLAAVRDLAPDHRAIDPLTPILLADLAFSLPADMLFKVDAASMRHALEVRVPLLDTSVVELAAGLPIEWKMGGGAQKRILRDAYRDVLPVEVLERGKMGFEVPIGEFLRGPLRDAWQEAVRDDVLQDLGLRPDTARAIWSDHQARRHERADILYALFVLCRWEQNRR